MKKNLLFRITLILFVFCLSFSLTLVLKIPSLKQTASSLVGGTFFSPDGLSIQTYNQNSKNTDSTQETDSISYDTDSIVNYGNSINQTGYPEKLIKYINWGCITMDELNEKGCQQLIVVDHSISHFDTESFADISFFECTNGIWEEKKELFCNGYVGAEGVFPSISEATRATPAGLMKINSAFYIDNAPVTGLNLYQITPDTYWIDDPNSNYYNQKIVGEEFKDWYSCEKMYYCTPAYNYGFEIGHNEECEADKGSAIFFHIGSGYTAGCVATAEENVLAYLKQLSKAENPYILII